MSGLVEQFYQSFIEADRWKRYLEGLGVSFTVTLGALALGIILGILVAIIRTLHDQQRAGQEKADLRPPAHAQSIRLGIKNDHERQSPLSIQNEKRYTIIFFS